MNRIKRSVIIQLLLVAMVFFMAGCGQRGPLYLPGQEPEPVKKNETKTNDTEDEGENTPGAGIE